VAPRIGLVGGLSWEATACYYRYFNQLHVGTSPWSQPRVLIDSTDMATIVELQRSDDWTATGLIMVDAARRDAWSRAGRA
jgi:aspartate/glutamate racemase